MPELPEVETTCLGLSKALLGARIIRAEQNRPNLRLPMPRNLPKKLIGRSITAIYRRAKYIIIELDNSKAMLLHLGMSGRLVVGASQQTTNKHDHVVIHCDGDRTLRFNDPRRFGMLDLCAHEELDNHPLLRNLGVEPLGKELTTAYLTQQFSGKKTPVKAALLDQHIIAGLGNIYVSEALYYAKIKPTRLAGTLQPDEISSLVPAVRQVLQAALKAGGSSLRDYVHSDGALGFFQDQFAVYDREGQRCPRCKQQKVLIERITQSGRSSFYCPNCQH
ncbi:MAG: bifunctional DNA-formamidopyrimidine glycosylase/DNA-(apurinic or apyrimidinic site) lyase [Alphaproteobacteria bacterium]|nr:bifunctional DNA-formamidopyrimidine glycosylase/DNA-(apurinic or apyrimidinic site) lyase [Alphaproteobacteria bacterium]